MTPIIFQCQEQEVLIKPKPSPRAKRLSLRLSTKDSSFVLTVPPRTAEAHIKKFLIQCTPWVEKILKKTIPVKRFIPGEEIFLHGTTFQCILDPLRRRPVLCKATQTLRLPLRCRQEDLYDFLKKLAEEKLTPYVMNAVQVLGQDLKKLTFRDTKSRWGSCSARKTISLSWRLVLVPPEVAQYVCIHEVAHLLHMNHSKAFWKVVEDLCPTYLSHRRWLKAHGAGLMRV